MVTRGPRPMAMPSIFVWSWSPRLCLSVLELNSHRSLWCDCGPGAWSEAPAPSFDVYLGSNTDWYVISRGWTEERGC